ncbi:hypothetical protein O7606_10240 [Micromonospora sp. WMMD882]|uniref:hypothetical protein n=1 Tax=Micromonospora sp. WMMD882 TaxID=3015151 RepID=UPI00248B1F66|nr:hypothetical protein [Micromonospora sp. WMMD882]WBB81705.1 hypothetical protein O7606_10240 [Micromonospora sp. WMMD882]
MRKVITGSGAATLATLGLIVAVPGSATAAAPAPWCDSGGSKFACDTSVGGPTTWTVTRTGTPYSFTVNTPGGSLLHDCSPQSSLTVSYSYVQNGTTVTSLPRDVWCNPGEWP